MRGRARRGPLALDRRRGDFLNLVPGFPAALAGLCVLLVPGLALLAVLGERDRRSLALDEALFLAVASSVCLSSWLGLVLAELGRFSLVTAGLLLLAFSLAVLALGRRRIGAPFARAQSWRALVPPAVVLTLSLALDARPSQYIVGGRDPGAYVASMALIGRTGKILYEDKAVLAIPREDLAVFFPNSEATSFSRFMGFDLESPESGRVVPQFFHLFPAFGAYLFQAMGVKGALGAPPIFGVLGTLAVFFAVRRVLGDATALLGALLLSANVIQVWFARYPLSETMSQFLLFLGLLATAHFEERRSLAFAGLAGTAFGLSLLVRIDSVLIAVPLAAYVLIRRAQRRLTIPELVALAGPFVLLALHATLHARLFASKYAQDILNRPYWKQPYWVWAALLALVVLVIACASSIGDRLAPWLRDRKRTLRTALLVCVTLVALYTYFLRPWLSAWAGGDGNTTPALADPSLLRALGFKRLAAHDAQSLLRFAWFVSPLGVGLGLFGLLLAIRQFRSRYLLLLLVAAAFGGFYFYKIRVWNDYYFALRRYIPVVLPALASFVAFFLTRLARRGGAARLVAALLALALAATYARDTRRIATHVDWNRTVDFVRELSRRFGPDDIVVFEQPRSIHLLSLPLWAIHGVNVLELGRFNPDPARLVHLVREWRPRFKNIYFVHTYSTDLCGLFLQRSEDIGFETVEWQRAYAEPPRRPETRALYFRISRLLLPEEVSVPALDDIDVGGSDDFQVSGFFDKEGGGDRTYRWTGRCGSIYAPGARAGATLVLTTSVGRRPDAPTVAVSLSGVSLGSFVPGHDWGEAELRLPDPLPTGPPVLRFDVKAFRPKNVDARTDDTRDLGVMIDRVRFRVDREPRATIAGHGGGR